MNLPSTDALEEALSVAQRELAEAEINVDRLRKVVVALEYVAELNSTTGKNPTLLAAIANGPSNNGDLTSMSRRAAVQKLLEESNKPMSPKQIASALVAAGRDDSPHAVSATLARLKTLGKVTSEGYGKWRPRI